MKLLGIDIGTTSICAVVFDSGERKLVARCTQRNDADLNSMDTFAHTQDPDCIWDTARPMVKDLLAAHPDVAAIGVSGQMHGILYVNEHGAAVSPLFTWQDERGNLSYGEDETYARAFKRLTGHAVPSGYGMLTHFYHVVNGRVPSTAASLCTIGDYVAMKLVGAAQPAMDVTNAANLGGWRNGQFDAVGLSIAGIVADFLPQVVPSAAQVGLTEGGIPVYAALGDNQASFLGSGASSADSVLVNIGTGAQISVRSIQAIRVSGWETRPFPGGGVLMVGATLGGGKTYSLLEQFFREVCRVFTDQEPGSLYDRMDSLMAAPGDGEDPMVISSQFFGTRSDPLAKGSISNISGTNFTPHALTSAFVEGMAAELKALYVELPEEVRQRTTTLIGAGNGMRRIFGLRQALERQFGIPLRLAPYEEEAAVGAALCAGVGIGVFADFPSAGRTLLLQH